MSSKREFDHHEQVEMHIDPREGKASMEDNEKN